jgi:cation transport protein ChaC
MKKRIMSLTPELVARCHRVVEDPGPSAGANYLTDVDYDALVDTMLAGRTAGEPLWLFAYGSLIWKPEIAHEEERVAKVRGWHRSFCISIIRWRGTREQPGLMMGLNRGGACQGVALRLPDDNPREQLGKLFRREIIVKPSTNVPRWLILSTESGPLSGLGFVINRKGRGHCGPLGEDEVASTLAAACGHWGSGADYLYNAVANLEMRGIHDRHLWRLQRLVADAIIAGK